MKKLRQLDRLVKNVENIVLKEYKTWAENPDTAYCVIEKITVYKEYEFEDTISFKMRIGCKTSADEYNQFDLILDSLEISKVMNKGYIEGYISCVITEKMINE